MSRKLLNKSVKDFNRKKRCFSGYANKRSPAVASTSGEVVMPSTGNTVSEDPYRVSQKIYKSIFHAFEIDEGLITIKDAACLARNMHVFASFLSQNGLSSKKYILTIPLLNQNKQQYALLMYAAKKHFVNDLLSMEKFSWKVQAFVEDGRIWYDFLKKISKALKLDKDVLERETSTAHEEFMDKIKCASDRLKCLVRNRNDVIGSFLIATRVAHGDKPFFNGWLKEIMK